MVMNRLESVTLCVKMEKWVYSLWGEIVEEEDWGHLQARKDYFIKTRGHLLFRGRNRRGRHAFRPGWIQLRRGRLILVVKTEMRPGRLSHALI